MLLRVCQRKVPPICRSKQVISVRTKHFSSFSKKHMSGPVYMNVHPHRQPPKVDRDGIPVEAPDDTPIGPENRPKRRKNASLSFGISNLFFSEEVDWHHKLTKSMKEYNILKWQEPTHHKWELKLHPSPKIPPIIPEARSMCFPCFLPEMFFPLFFFHQTILFFWFFFFDKNQTSCFTFS